MSAQIEIEVPWHFPPKLKFLFRHHRYKVGHGGRGGSKSWGFSRALLLKGMDSRLRIGCFREVQKSIKDSVHKLLSDQIDLMDIADHYHPQKTEILAENGTEFLFSGLSDQTSDSIKSFEGLDIAWVEEAHKVTRRSWDILIPTIRKAGSEIWISLNPELETDETYDRFVENPPADAEVVYITWRDNPWFPEVLEKERQEFLRQVAIGKRTQDDYDNIWEGKPRAAVEGAIYANEVQKLKADKRLCRIPYDPLLPVHRVWDLGWNDAMVVGMWQRSPQGLMLIDSVIVTHTRYSDLVASLSERKYRWGRDFVPHDAKHKNPQTGKGADDTLRELGCDIAPVEDIGLEAGIKLVRQEFGRLWIDDKTGDNKAVVHALRRYRRTVNSVTNEPGAPLHDDASHPADMVRYAVISANEMVARKEIKDPYAAFRRAG